MPKPNPDLNPLDPELGFTLNDSKPGYWPIRLHWIVLGCVWWPSTPAWAELIAVIVWLVCFIHCLTHKYEL